MRAHTREAEGGGARGWCRCWRLRSDAPPHRSPCRRSYNLADCPGRRALLQWLAADLASLLEAQEAQAATRGAGAGNSADAASPRPTTSAPPEGGMVLQHSTAEAQAQGAAPLRQEESEPAVMAVLQEHEGQWAQRQLQPPAQQAARRPSGSAACSRSGRARLSGPPRRACAAGCELNWSLLCAAAVSCCETVGCDTLHGSSTAVSQQQQQRTCTARHAAAAAASPQPHVGLAVPAAAQLCTGRGRRRRGG